MGQVIGKSDSRNKSSHHPIQTRTHDGYYHALSFDLGQVRLIQSLPNELRSAMTETNPISELI